MKAIFFCPTFFRSSHRYLKHCLVLENPWQWRCIQRLLIAVFRTFGYKSCAVDCIALFGDLRFLLPERSAFVFPGCRLGSLCLKALGNSFRIRVRHTNGRSHFRLSNPRQPNALLHRTDTEFVHSDACELSRPCFTPVSKVCDIYIFLRHRILRHYSRAKRWNFKLCADPRRQTCEYFLWIPRKYRWTTGNLVP